MIKPLATTWEKKLEILKYNQFKYRRSSTGSISINRVGHYPYLDAINKIKDRWKVLNSSSTFMVRNRLFHTNKLPYTLRHEHTYYTGGFDVYTCPYKNSIVTALDAEAFNKPNWFHPEPPTSELSCRMLVQLPCTPTF